jgi:hypothetical protein
MGEDHCDPWVKGSILFFLVVYFYGAMCLKYVSGAESLMETISYLMYDEDRCKLNEKIPIDPYYIGIFVFTFLSSIFAFGNIDNAKWI